MSAGRYINLPAAILFLLLLAAFVACAFAMVSIATPEPGRPDGYLVLGGALVLGVSLGTAYEIAQARKGGKSPPLNRRPSPASLRDRRSPPVLGLTLSAVGAALVLRALVPEVFGWSLDLVAPMLVVGLLLPRLTSSMWLEFRRIRDERDS